MPDDPHPPTRGTAAEDISRRASTINEAPLEALKEPEAAVLTLQSTHPEGSALRRGKTPVLTDQTNRLPTKQIVIIFLGAASAILISLLDQNEVATAIPSISATLGDGSQSAWISSAFFLTSTVSQSLWARLSDIFGRKPIFLVALAVFAVGVTACSVAQTMTELIVFRALAGIGGGSTMTLAQICIGDVVAPRARGKYQGLLTIFIVLANSCGPLIGGVIVQNTTFRWIFWSALPLTALSAAIIWFALPLKQVEGNYRAKLAKIDYVGAAMLLSALTLILVSLNFGGVTLPWTSSTVLSTLIIGLVCAVAFVVWEAKVPRLPLMPMRVFRIKTVSAIVFCSLINGMAFYAQIFYIPSFFQITRNFSPISAGLTLIPISVSAALTSAVSGLLVSRTGHYKHFISLGFAIWSVGLGLLSTLDEGSGWGKIIGYGILTGIGVGQTLSICLVAAQSAVRREDMAATTACRNLARQLGGTVALSIAGSVINNQLTTRAASLGLSSAVSQQILNDPKGLHSDSSGLDAADRASMIDAYRAGFRITWYILAGLTTIAFIVSVLFVEQLDLKTSSKEEKDRAKAWLEARKRKKTDEPTANSPAIELEDLESPKLTSRPTRAMDHVMTPVK